MDVYAGTRDQRTNFEQALTAARRAVSLDPELGIARTSLAFGLWNVGDWENGEGEFRRALELSPGYASAHQWYALSLFSTGSPDDAVIHAERAVSLDPVSPQISRNLGWALEAAGRSEEAIEQYRETIDLAPGWVTAWANLSIALLWRGEYEDGLEAWGNAAALANVPVEPAIGWYQAMIRHQETGVPQTVTISAPLWTGSSGPWLYSAIGQHDQAVRMQEENFESGFYGIMGLMDALYPVFDDARYQALLEEAGITW